MIQDLHLWRRLSKTSEYQKGFRDTQKPVFDPVAMEDLTFEAVRTEQFPMLALGIAAGRAGGAAPAVYNAANERAVAHFLDGRLRFGDIPRHVERAMAAHGSMPSDTRAALLAEVFELRPH